MEPMDPRRRIDPVTGRVVHDVLGEAELDLAIRDLFGANGIYAGSLQPGSRPGGGLVDQWEIRRDRSAAGQQFRLDAALNIDDPNYPDDQRGALYLDAIVRFAGGRVDQTDNTIRMSNAWDFGRAVGWTIAHEFAHLIGLVDEYVLTADTAYTNFASGWPNWF